MIQVTRLDDSKVMLNVEKIQSMQAAPDTVITFTNENCIIVKEPVEEISQKILEYQRSINEPDFYHPGSFQECFSTLH